MASDNCTESASLLGSSIQGNLTDEVRVTRDIDHVSPNLSKEEEDQMNDTFKQLVEIRKIPLPYALVSIISSSGNFSTTDKIARRLKNGFMEAAKNGEWIIIDETDCELVTFIKSAVLIQEIKSKNKQKNIISLIGLTKSEQTNPTEKDHMHTIRIDTENVADFKSKFEIFVRNFIYKDEQSGEGKYKPTKVPMVAVLWGGNVDSLEYTKRYLKERIPVIIIANSGGAADFITEYLKYLPESSCEGNSQESPQENRRVKKLLQHSFGYLDTDPYEKLIGEVTASLKVTSKDEHDKWIHYYSIEDNEKSLDIVIHQVLFKQFKEKLEEIAKDREGKTEVIEQQLNLVQEWNMCDLAKEKIFTPSNRRQIKEVKIFEKLLKDALIMNKYDFAVLYLDHIHDIQKFVTDNLAILFTEKNKSSDDNTQGKTSSDDNTQKKAMLENIGECIRLLVRGSSNPFMKEDTYPYRDLMIWALVMNRMELANKFWKRAKDTIGSALYASSLLHGLSRIASDEANHELHTSYIKDSKAFQLQGYAVMTQLYNTDEHAAHRLLKKPMPQYGNTSILPLVVRNGLKKFTENTACQTKVNNVWRGDIAPGNSMLKIIVCCLLPFLVLTPFIKFNSQNDQTKRGKLYNFFDAPVTKFTYHVVSYTVFLVVFSAFTLSDLYPLSEGGPTFFEIIIWCWIVTMYIEEIRQITMKPEVTAKEKLKTWFSDIWNMFDLAIFIMVSISIILRMIPLILIKDFYYARLSYTVTLAMFYLRYMQFFLVSKFFGPKVIMIGKMIADTCFFMGLLALFVLSFGIMYQATLFPNTELSWQLLKDIIYMPFWQLYGALYIDDVEGKEPSDCTNEPALYTNGILKRCPQTSSTNLAVLGVYLILTQILLLNVLIALFANIFKKIQTSSRLVWKFHFVGLVLEYAEKPVLNPPLNIICMLYRLVKTENKTSPDPTEEEEEADEAVAIIERDGIYRSRNVKTTQMQEN